jgi:hypothetical protein
MMNDEIETSKLRFFAIRPLNFSFELWYPDFVSCYCVGMGR